jgi:hypothetical protein
MYDVASSIMSCACTRRSAAFCAQRGNVLRGALAIRRRRSIWALCSDASAIRDVSALTSIGVVSICGSMPARASHALLERIGLAVPLAPELVVARVRSVERVDIDVELDQ